MCGKIVQPSEGQKWLNHISNIIHTYLNILKVSEDHFWQCQNLNYTVNYAMNYVLPAIGRPGPSKKNIFWNALENI